MFDHPVRGLKLALMAGVALTGVEAVAQQAQTDADTVVVIGSYIGGVGDSGALPVTVMNRDELDAIGAVSTGELLSNIPALGDVQFTDNNTGTNGARGDVTGANLRGLGSGRTLTLVNGRRIAPHPQSEAVDSVPTTFTNVNAIPGNLIQRVEVLRDGASALYGSDAIAGVVNMSLFDSFDDGVITARYGAGTDLPYEEYGFSALKGIVADGGRTNLNVALNYYHRGNVNAVDYPLWYGTLDRRQLVHDGWIGDTQWDNRSTASPYGRFRAGTLNPNGTFTGFNVRRGTTNITTATGTSSGGYHIQTPAQAGSLATLAPGVTLDDSSTLDRDLYYNFVVDETVIPRVHRLNLGATFTHELDGGVEFFSEALYYYSESKTQRAPGPIDTSLAFLMIPKENYYNPFGPIGSPNRVAGINAPAEGLDSVMVAYRPIELGPRIINVEQELYRLLGGFRFDFAGWKAETALGWSEASSRDDEFNRLSKSLLQAQLSLSTPDAFNPFWGPYANSENVLSKVRVFSTRYGESSLLTWDAKAVKNDLFALPGGFVAAALGVDFRREEILEDSDPRLDGTIQYTNGPEPDRSDLVGVSATDDFTGERNVWSAFGEVQIPIVGDGNRLPLVHALDLQLAGRFESSNDFGDNFKPKAAAHWFLSPGLSLRASYGEGFRAPNLAQINQGDITRRNQGAADYYRSNVTATPADTGETYRSSIRAGNPDLEAEESVSRVLGVIYAPRGGALNGLRISLDYFEVETSNAIANIGVSRLLQEDFDNRIAGGPGIPEVIRAAVTPDDIAAFDAFNAANPTARRAVAGEVINVLDGYVNLDRREAAGYDAAISYAFPESALGSFEIGASATNMLRILEIQDDGTSFDDVRYNGNPEWRVSAFLNWRKGPWKSGWTARYVSEVEDSSATLDTDTSIMWTVDSWHTVNGYVSYEFEQPGGMLSGSELKLGVRNLFNEMPPYADETYGYLTSLYPSEGRVVYLEAKKTF